MVPQFAPGDSRSPRVPQELTNPASLADWCLIRFPAYPMDRSERGAVALKCFWLMLAAAVLWMQSPLAIAAGQPLRISLMTTQEDALAPERIVTGSYDRQFLPAVAGEVLRLQGGGGFVHWLRFEFELPAAASREPGAQWALLLHRVMLERLTLYLPGRDGQLQTLHESFFSPQSDDRALGSRFAFLLPHALEGSVVVYASVRTRAAVNLTAELLERQDYHAVDRGIGMLLVAIYTAIIVLVLNALALYLALHDRVYLFFVGLGASAVLFLAALNGHLYGVPGLQLFGWWGVPGVFLLGLLSSAFLVRFTQAFIGSDGIAAGLDRALTWLWYALLGAAAVCLIKLQALTAPIQSLGIWAMGLTSLLVASVAVLAWRRGSRAGGVLSIILPFLALAIWARIAAEFGWVAPGYLTQYGFQIVSAICAFLLSVGLADRVFAYRQERDEVRELVEKTDVSLQAEQNRRQFVEGLRESLRTCPPADMVWVTARRLLTAVRQLLPLASAGIAAVGYRGFDLLLSEPGEAKERYARLLAARGSTLKGICRTRTPVQARFDEAAGDDLEQAALGGRFAVIPMSVARPGWGALLLERAEWEEFSSQDLKSAQELCEVAESALDDALNQAELRKRAEIDPLTGVYNRRAFDAMIEKLFERALQTRQQIAVLFLDLDLFKPINDKHGHACGDECLRAVCDAARRELAAGDILARYGGEEFVVVLPGQTPDQARQVAERIRASVAQLRVESEKGVVKMTISIGLAGRGAEEEDPQAMVGRADKALYVAKRNGRNQVQVAPTYGQGSAGNNPPPPEAPIGF